jgi:hypothetical protein
MTLGMADAGRAAAALAALGTLLACLAVIHALPGDAYWAGDGASRALLAQRLLDTRYTDIRLDHPARAFDPAGIAYPLPDLALRSEDGFTSIFPVAYPALAAPALALGGPAALRWPAALGSAACAALFALWLAPLLSFRAALTAGLALGLATPLFFYGVVVWEHSLCVALALGASVLATRDDARRLMLGGLLLGLACWLREELVIFVATFALAVALTWRRPSAGLAALAGSAPPLLALVAWNAAVYGTPLGPHTAALDPAAALALPGAQLPRRIAALISGYAQTEREATGLALASLAAIAFGALAAWRGFTRVALAGSAAVGLALWIIMAGRAQAVPALLGLVLYNGWLAQLPAACLAGAGAVALVRDDALRPLRSGVFAGLGFLLVASAVGLATQSVFGTGLHVGPRLLMPALPALAALAVVALLRGPRTLAGGLAALLMLAGALASVQSIRLLAGQLRDVDALQRALRARPERVVLSGDAMLTQLLAGIWTEKPLLYAPTGELLERVMPQSESFLVLASDATPIVRDGVRCRSVAYERGGRLGYVDTDLLSCVRDAVRADVE